MRRLAGSCAVGRGASERIEHLLTRRSFRVFVNLLVGGLELVDFQSALKQLQVGSLVTWLGESVYRFWARLPVPPRLLLLTPPTLVPRHLKTCQKMGLDGLYSFWLIESNLD